MILLALVLLLAGIRMLISPSTTKTSIPMKSSKKIVSGIMIGLLIGLMGGLLGIGGGVFVVPLLIYVIKTPTKIAAASSTFIVCFSSLTGFLGYASQGEINWGFILPAAIAAFVGGQVGARLVSTGLKGKNIHVLFSIVLFILCIKLLYQSVFI